MSEKQPISTAPRDGTHILLIFGQDGISEGWYEDNDDDPYPWKFLERGHFDSPYRNKEGINGVREDSKYGPTAWLPIPTP